MKVILIIALFALASATPKIRKLHFRNLYKDPIIPLDHKAPRIIGGQEAEPHSIPWQAFLEVYSEGKGWYCGGSLISENYVVTAAHCGVNASVAYVTLGAHRPQEVEDTQLFIVSRDVKIHEKYDSARIDNDVAVIHLPDPVKLTTEIQPVKLPTDTSKDYAGQTARVSGWGRISPGGERSEVLKYLDLEVITNADCMKVFGSLSDGVVCGTGSKGTTACNGDSGGPLVVDDTLIGVTSFVVRDCPGGSPTGFARVTTFLKWLKANSDV